MASPDPPPDDPLGTIILRASGIDVHVSPFGATITKLFVPDKHGNVADVVLGYDDFASYDDTKDRPYFGAIVGRVANRIAGAKFSLVADGTTKHYDALVANNSPNTLHGGAKGFDRYWWTVASQSEDGTSVRLTRISPDGEEGFPGACAVDVEYRVSQETYGSATLHTTITATVDKPCPVNFAQHSYFNLAGHDGGKYIKITALEHRLRLEADHYTPVDDTCIPTGELRHVEDTHFNFTEIRRIGDSLPDKNENDPDGFDHNFALSGYDEKKKEMKVFAEVHEPDSGRKMEVSCNQPGVQLYTGNFLNGQVGKEGVVYEKHSGLCLETQHFPNCVNQVDKFVSCVLRPGETYHHTLRHRFWAE